jgi:hypothetical protein
MQHASALSLALVLAACGGSSPPAAVGPTPQRSGEGEVVREPLVVEIRATRVGAAMRLDVEAMGRGAREGDPFEDPTNWTMSAQQNDRPLDRLVNGPVHIDRRPAGQEQWDTLVRFSVVFEVVDDVAPVRARLTPPGSPAVERAFSP